MNQPRLAWLASLCCVALVCFSALARPAGKSGSQSSSPVIPYSLPTFQLNHDVQMPLRFHDLYDFDYAKNGPVSPVPIGTMVQGPTGDDDFYSTTEHGGQFRLGSIFQFDAKSRSLKVLYSFGAGRLTGGGLMDANSPRGGVSLGHDGALYGTTTAGGKFNAGVIFKIGRDGSNPQVLYSFHNGAPDPPVKGQPPPPPLTQQEKDDIAAGVPWSAPLMGLDGSLYGVTPTAESAATGVLYQLTGTTLKAVYRFTPAQKADFGLMPITLSRGWDGEFYGVTWAGGKGQGTIFRFDPAAQSGPNHGITTLYEINNSPPHEDGSNPYSVMEGVDRNLYGVMSAGGPYYRGVVFQITQNGNFNMLHAFGGTDSRPGPGLVEVLQDDPQQPGVRSYYLYGAASWNASISTRFDSGILFRLRENPFAGAGSGNPDPYNFSTVYNMEGPPGLNPSTTPMLGRDSNLYGMTAAGGAASYGTFYRLDTAYDVTGDPNSMTYTNPDGKPHTRVALRGDPSGRTAITDNRSPIQVVTSVAVSSANEDAISKALTSDGITVRVKDVPPFIFWMRPNATKHRAKIVQFFYRARIDSKGKWISGLAEAWDPLQSYYEGAYVRYNNNYWYSMTSVGNIGKIPPANQDCLRVDRECSNEPIWRPVYSMVDKANPYHFGAADFAKCNQATQVCTLIPPCTGDPFAAGAAECFQLSSPAKLYWMVDAQGRQPDQFGDVNPFYSPPDTEIDDDGVTVFDTPTLIRNFPGGPILNPNETQFFTAKDYVIIDNKVVATVDYTLSEKPGQDEAYGAPNVIPGPPSLEEQECFGQLLTHYHFSDPFPLPSESNPKIKCTTPYY